MNNSENHRYLVVSPQPEIGSLESKGGIPAGQIWMCAACGKRSKDVYGNLAIDRGWDASCSMNAVLVYEYAK